MMRGKVVANKVCSRIFALALSVVADNARWAGFASSRVRQGGCEQLGHRALYSNDRNVKVIGHERIESSDVEHVWMQGGAA